MPTSQPWSGAPVPIIGEADNIPAVLAAYADVVDPMLVITVTDQAERDGTYADAPAGLLLSCPSAQCLWQKLNNPPAAAQWRTYGYKTAWATPPITWFSGWADAGCTARFNGDQLELFIVATCEVDVGPFSASGRISDRKVCDLPAGYRPHLNRPVQWGYAGSDRANGGGIIYASGGVWITDGHPTLTVEAGAPFTFYASYLVS